MLVSLNKLILTDDTDIGNAVGDALRDIIIPEIEHLQWEVGRLNEERALAGAHLDVCF